MPSHSRNTSGSIRTRPDLTTEPLESDRSLQEQEPTTARLGRKKNKNATSKHPVREEYTDEVLEDEITREPSLSPSRPSSQSRQIPRTFPHRPRPDFDDVDEEVETEKVTDGHTPPQEALSAYGRTPPELIPRFTQAASPRSQYIHPERGGFNNARSPPTSPPQAKSRPISYSSLPPSHLAQQRVSPYAYPSNAYGSPPSLPHLPQPHFYGAKDVNVGTGSRPQSARSQRPSLVKFTELPGAGPSRRDAVFVGLEGQLDVLGGKGDKFEQIGSLKNIPGDVQDAIFLTWSNGSDPCPELRPLVAVTISENTTCHTAEQVNHSRRLSTQSSAVPQMFANASDVAPRQKISVRVYSLRTLSLVAELLHISIEQQFSWDAFSANTPPASVQSVTLQASGNHLIASLGGSGETYVFTVCEQQGQTRFECLVKLWTTLQPSIRRRGSSHTRSSSHEVSPADAHRGIEFEQQPICCLSGRWLAYCPSSVSKDSLNATLGQTVIGDGPSITSRTAPSRPSISCEIDSPDAPTLLGKIAKGAAQELVRGSKWLGQKSMQTWNSYWNAQPLQHGPPSQPAIGTSFQPSPFPPTHGEEAATIAKEPEVVSLIDLHSLQATNVPGTESSSAFATFQPLGGCGFLSFTPNGLGLLTATREGDVYYVWDLLQIRHTRTVSNSPESEAGQLSARVRQIAKYERLSPSVVVDVEWEDPGASRFAVLTQNRTIHMYDIPAIASKWPPPRQRNVHRPVSAPVDPPLNLAGAPSGFFATARNYAGQAASQAQPMIANLRGRAPSMSGGVSGIGSQASATGIRGGKVVAAGFSKSLGAASETVANLHHAGQSKLHLKIEPVPGRLSWRRRDQNAVLAVLSTEGIRIYYVRKSNPHEGRQNETVSVFDARKPVGIRLPAGLDAPLQQQSEEVDQGFWTPITQAPEGSSAFVPPLSFAEIETNAPSQPFHSDARVTMSTYPEPGEMTDSVLPTASAIFHPQQSQVDSTETGLWIFGRDIPTVKLNLGSPRASATGTNKLDSVVYRETIVEDGHGDNEAEHIVSTTKRRRKKIAAGTGDGTGGEDDPEEGFFEDDTVVLEYADTRV